MFFFAVFLSDGDVATTLLYVDVKGAGLKMLGTCFVLGHLTSNMFEMKWGQFIALKTHNLCCFEMWEEFGILGRKFEYSDVLKKKVMG